MQGTIQDSVERIATYLFVALLVVGGYFLATAVSATLTEGSVESFAEQSDEALIAPGTWLLRFEGVEATYYVSAENQLRQISITNTKRLYGDNWTELLLVLPQDAYSFYRIAHPVGSEEYPDHLFITDGESRCYIEAGRCRPVTESGMQQNGISERFLQQVDTEIIHSFELGELIDA